MWPEREGEREHMGDFPYFQAFFWGFNVNIGDWRYLMLERELPRLSTNEKRHPPNGILQTLQEII
jgi:hypothetical protein